MKYRIKIKTCKDGTKECKPYIKKTFWRLLDYKGEIVGLLFDVYPCSKNEALERIDKHFNNRNKKVTIEFEYITKC